MIDLGSDSSVFSSSNPEHNYVNDTVIAANRDNRREPATFFDAFDMRKFIYKCKRTLNLIIINYSIVNLIHRAI